jgi:hypothetical protein
MDRVPVIAATYFDFGAPPIVASQSENTNAGNVDNSGSSVSTGF